MGEQGGESLISASFKETLKMGFDTYTSKYDISDERIYGKIVHTYAVAANCIYICNELKLNDHDEMIAYAIGMLHDVGRFEQASKYHTFIDSVSDHAIEGADYLFNQGGISNFIPEKCFNREDLKLIETAIRQHNKHLLDEGLSERELLFCNIIRDADKIDIYRFNAKQSFEVSHEYTEKEVASSEPSEIIIEAFRNKQTVDFSKRKTKADIYLSHVALCFGLVFDSSKKLLDSQGNIWKMMDFSFDNPKVQDTFNCLRKDVESFLRD